MTLKNAVRQFYFWQSSNGHNPGTARMYRSILEDLPCQEMEIQQITPQSLQDHLSSLNGISPSTRNVKKSCLKSFFRWAMENDFIQKDSSRLIHLEKIPMKEAPYLNPGEIKRLREVIKANPRDQLLFEFYLNTGCRLSEVASLNCNIKGKKVVTIVGKGNKSRQIFLTPLLTKLVRNSVNGSTSEMPLFQSQRGQRLSAPAIQSLFKTYLRKAGIDSSKYHVHSLRHTFLTEVYRKTKDLRLTQELAGHSSPAMTARYCHVNEQDKRKAIQSLYSGN